ncbi:MAG: hypothetical protein JJ863_11940 [Deltaproteobacteria bacterium]|nr:hypothetical protein [Deltaproteobacteria bacterium]
MTLEPLSYHHEVVAALRREEPGLWEWFASDEVEEAFAERVRLDLLKSTVRLGRGQHGALHEAADAAKAAFDLDVDVRFYQAAAGVEINAGLCHLPGEAHVVLSGPVLDKLDALELRALVGHELAHQKLLTLGDGEHRIAQQLLRSIADHHGAAPSYLFTAQRLEQMTEVVADRGGCLVAGDVAPMVRCLAKTISGLTTVDAESYAAQAADVMRQGADAGEGTHPETFARVHLLVEGARAPAQADALVDALIRGPIRMDALDLVGQLALVATTRALIGVCLAEPLLATERVRAHAAEFFEGDVSEQGPVVLPDPLHESVAEYLAYVLLDLATVDPDTGDLAIGLVDRVATEHGFGNAFEAVARKELRRSKKAVAELRAQLPSLEERARAQGPS